MRVFKKLSRRHFDPTQLDFGRRSERDMLASRRATQAPHGNASHIAAMRPRGRGR